MTHITSLTITNFRNYDSASIDGLGNGFIILVGENGAGKTNCLEAISLLSPGRGLRGASIPDCQSSSAPSPWAVSAQITDIDGDTSRLGVGRNPDRMDKKLIRHDGDTVKSQQDLGEIFRTIWLTPQMDGLFLQGASERRRFFDRMVAAFDPAHTGRLTRYEKAMRERINILKTAHEKGTIPDATWLTGIENILAETAVAIIAARLDLLEKLQKEIQKSPHKNFPLAKLNLMGDTETELQNQSALCVEDRLRQKLKDFRQSDAMTGRTHVGAHRSDLSVIYTDKNQSAAQCSTGEQKALLTTMILAHASLTAKRFGAPPVLLFDEICAHFDSTRRDALFETLDHLGGQIWLTGQDEDAFKSITNNQLYYIQNNKLT